MKNDFNVKDNKMKSMNDKAKNMKKNADKIGNTFITIMHYIGLFIIGGIVAWAGFCEFINIVTKGSPGAESILTLFIYLELAAMVGYYFQTNHMPIRFILYVALTAMTRHLIGVISDHGTDYKMVIFYCLGIFILTASVLVIRYGTFHYQLEEPKSENEKV
jgi:phosphate starvation-inducible membrane PsiE